jgi:hypothetical protein
MHIRMYEVDTKSPLLCVYADNNEVSGQYLLPSIATIAVDFFETKENNGFSYEKVYSIITLTHVDYVESNSIYDIPHIYHFYSFLKIHDIGWPCIK